MSQCHFSLEQPVDWIRRCERERSDCTCQKRRRLAPAVWLVWWLASDGAHVTWSTKKNQKLYCKVHVQMFPLRTTIVDFRWNPSRSAAVQNISNWTSNSASVNYDICIDEEEARGEAQIQQHLTDFRHNVFFSQINTCRSFSERFVFSPRRHTFSFDCSGNAMTQCLSESAATFPLCTTCHWMMARPSIFKRGLSRQISRMTGLVRMPCEKRQNWKRKNKDKKKKKSMTFLWWKAKAWVTE